jgi:hypothetical protein
MHKPDEEEAEPYADVPLGIGQAIRLLFHILDTESARARGYEGRLAVGGG